jgi:uncharacterized protein YjcR
VEVARKLGKNVRTIRRWQQLTGFEAELAKATQRHERAAARRKQRNDRRRLARSDPHRYAQLYGVASGRPGQFRLAAKRAVTEPRRGGRVLPVIRW